jgi:hypothetical protein
MIDSPTRSDAAKLSDEQLLEKLQGFGLEGDRAELERLCEGALSAEQVCEEALRRFPDEDELMVENRRRAVAESCFELGETDKAETLFEQWLAADPRWGWLRPSESAVRTPASASDGRSTERTPASGPSSATAQLPPLKVRGSRWTG